MQTAVRDEYLPPRQPATSKVNSDRRFSAEMHGENARIGSELNGSGDGSCLLTWGTAEMSLDAAIGTSTRSSRPIEPFVTNPMVVGVH